MFDVSELEVEKFWIFQSNPKTYPNIFESCKDKNRKEVWPIPRYAKEVKKGHYCFVWICGKKAGIYSIGEVITDVFPNDPESEEYKANMEYMAENFDYSYYKNLATVRYTYPLPNYISRSDLSRLIPGHQIIKTRVGTVFDINEDDKKEILGLIEK